MPGVRSVEVAPGPIDAVVAVPGSKSIANRALVCAALATGDSELLDVPDGDDTVAMLDGLHRLGVEIAGDGDRRAIRGGAIGRRPATLDAALAGTTSRFLTAVAALGTAPITIDGAPPLRRRPMGPLHAALEALGVRVTPRGEVGRLPVTVEGPLTRGGRVELRGDVSSQYLTALMLIAPVLDDGLAIELTTPLVSAPYVQLTASVMASFGADGVAIEERHIDVPPGRYEATEYTIEPDASSASYALATAAVTGGRIRIPGLTRASAQADAAFAELLGRMGCRVHDAGGSIGIERDPTVALTGIDVDMSARSDLVPTLAVVAVTASTPTRITGVGFIRTKESDRLGDLAAELLKTGASVSVEPDGLRIDPAGALHGARLATHHDHRLAMAFAVLGAVVPGIEIEDPGVVSKSWPGFWAARDGMVGV